MSARGSSDELVSSAGSGDWAAEAADETTQQRMESVRDSAEATDWARAEIARIQNGG